MARRNRCSLCGERLDSSLRCTVCGLDNSKNDDMYKHLLNQSSCADEPLTHVHEEPKVNKNYGKVTYTYRNNAETAKPFVKTTGTAKKQGKKKGSSIAILISVLAVFSTVIPTIATLVNEFSYGIREEAYPEYEFTIEEDFNSEYWLGQGFYEVGIHLPEGDYTVMMDYGEYASVDLYEFDGEYWGNTDFWYFDVYEGESVHEMWLEMGDIIVVNADEDLIFRTMEDGYGYSGEDVYLGAYENYYISDSVVVGQDIPAGVYDIYYSPYSQMENGYVSLSIADFTEYEGQMMLYFDAEYGEEYYFNVPLTPGTVLEMDEGIEGITLMTSGVVSQQMYDMTWGAE